jgi:hypothetical protein
MSVNNIELHEVDYPIQVLPEGRKFGVLTVKVDKTPMTEQPILFVFSIDRTASMDEFGGDTRGKSKLDYVKQTFANIMRFLAAQGGSESSPEIYVRIHAFNTDVDIIVDTVRITMQNVEQIIGQIQALTADDCTNIGLAMDTANRAIRHHLSRHSNIPWIAAHLFMTDGQPTAGMQNYADIAGLVDDSFINVFFGFGTDHNSHLLTKCAEASRAEYGFIDNAERAGAAYANSIHGILYPGLSDLRVFMEHGLIYDWTTNRWVNEIREPAWSSESTKNYHLSVARGSEFDMAVVIFGKRPGQDDEETLLGTVELVPNLVDNETGEEDLADLSPFLFRQAVQEALFLAKSMNTMTDYDVLQKTKKSMKTLFGIMRKYMRDHGKMVDSMMIQLCDDLSISYNTLGTEEGIMYTIQREGSQGRQQSNTTSTPRYDAASHTPMRRHNAFSPPMMGRMNAVMDTQDLGGFREESEDEEESQCDKMDVDSNASTVVADGFLPIPPQPVLRRYLHNEVIYTRDGARQNSVLLPSSIQAPVVPEQRLVDDQTDALAELDTTSSSDPGILREVGYRGERDPITGKKNGFGKKMYPNHDVYIGEWENNFWNGRGRYKFAAGRVFDGEFVYGVWQGSSDPTYLEEPTSFVQESMDNLGGMGIGTGMDIEEGLDDIENYVCSDNEVSAYATPSAVDMMRSMTQSNI